MSSSKSIVSRNSRIAALFLVGALLMPTVGLAQTQTAGEASVHAVETAADGLFWISQGQLHFAGENTQSYALPEAAQDASDPSLAVAPDNRLYVAGEGFGVYQSEDGGQSWQKSGSGLPEGPVTAVAAHSTLAHIAYAYSPGDGMYRTEDSGKTWSRIDAGPQETVRVFAHTNLPGSMETGWLFAGTERGVARSMDCFCFWGDAGDLRGEVTALAYDAGAPENVYAVTGNELYHSADGGESWSPIAAPEAVSALAVSDSRLYAGTEQGLLVLNDGQWENIDEQTGK